MIGLHPITATLGAEVSGVDLADMDGATSDQLRKAWMDHKVLVIRDQHITREQHMAFGRRFGDLEVHPFVPDETGGTLPPEIVRLESSADRQVAASVDPQLPVTEVVQEDEDDVGLVGHGGVPGVQSKVITDRTVAPARSSA